MEGRRDEVVQSLKEDFSADRLKLVAHQTVALKGNRKEIFNYVDKLHSLLSVYNGGLIGNIEDYACMGMSEENYKAIVDAFSRYV